MEMSVTASCTKLGILQNNDEWNQVLTEADFIRAPAVRKLYITILLYCEPADPGRLFQGHWEKWTDDIVRDAQQKGITLSL